MLKIVTKTKAGAPLLCLGMSGENITRLVAGEPVMLEPALLRQLGLPPFAIAVIYGKTETDLLAEFREHGVKITPSPDGVPQWVFDRLRMHVMNPFEVLCDTPAEVWGGKTAAEWVAAGDGTWEDVVACFGRVFSWTT